MTVNDPADAVPPSSAPTDEVARIPPALDDAPSPGWPAVGLATLQKRGTLTIPTPLRARLHLPDGARVILRTESATTVRVDVLPPPRDWLASWDDRVPTPPPVEDASGTPTRWLDTDTLLRAQAFPQGAARAWLAECDQGFHPVRIDPAVIADVLDRLPTVLPGLTRLQIARYVQTMLSWTGVECAERDFYLTALDQWGASAVPWATAVQTGREALAATDPSPEA